MIFTPPVALIVSRLSGEPKEFAFLINVLSPSTIRFAALNWITGDSVLVLMISPPVIWIVLGVAPTKPEQLRLDFNVPFPVTVTLPLISPSNTTAFSSLKPAVSIVISSLIGESLLPIVI